MLFNSHEGLDHSWSSYSEGRLAGQSATAIKERARETRSARKKRGKKKALVDIQYFLFYWFRASHSAPPYTACPASWRDFCRSLQSIGSSSHWTVTGNQTYWYTVVIFYLYFPNNLESNACVWCCVLAQFSLEILCYKIGLKTPATFSSNQK